MPKSKFQTNSARAHLETAPMRFVHSLAPRSGERVRERGSCPQWWKCTELSITIPTPELSAAFDGPPPNPARIHLPLAWSDESTWARAWPVQPLFWASSRCAPTTGRATLPVPPKAIALWRLRFHLPYSCLEYKAKLPAKQAFSTGLFTSTIAGRASGKARPKVPRKQPKPMNAAGR